MIRLQHLWNAHYNAKVQFGAFSSTSIQWSLFPPCRCRKAQEAYREEQKARKEKESSLLAEVKESLHND